MSARLLFLSLLCLLMAESTFARYQKVDNKGNTISVTGSGIRSYKTSIAVVRLGIEASGRTALAVQNTLARDSSRLSNFLKRQKVKKLTTSGVSLSAQRNWKVKPAKIVGYTGRNTASFEVPVKDAGAILDGAVKNGASQISGISFKAAPAASAIARKAAIRDAVKNAQMEAEIAVSALGRSLCAPKEIRITDSFIPQATLVPRRQFARLSKARGAAPISQIRGGDSSASARVSVIFKITGSKSGKNTGGGRTGGRRTGGRSTGGNWRGGRYTGDGNRLGRWRTGDQRTGGWRTGSSRRTNTRSSPSRFGGRQMRDDYV